MIRPDETLIEGQWLSNKGCTLRDAACERISGLLQSHLRRIGSSADGLRTTFEDPSDGRLWELSFPHRHMQGGGPPRLRFVATADPLVPGEGRLS